jgi:fibronectin type 3 domain-containing protein
VNANLKDGTQHTYHVQAVDEDDLLSDISAPAIAKTKPLPVKPTGLMTSEREGRKLLQWEPNPEKDVKQYNLYRKGFMGLAQKIATVQGNVWDIPEGMKGKIELFLKAINEAGLESEGSDPVVMVLDKK